ncbi:adhesion G protein-coupled receptor E2 [Cheilinus undulatus]|uniref:adhesion G protein-coupled receptor E2 n=1 Tax=Cheilinus undulatus TaxID=241271 RepID=UPI001BD4C69D|nr:adhesion G protein-coupled receptor E2 [Cheilinus undulatus]XP_041634230.1 adhesion G protein-coupled receptor E2 [Cheilinus undulatus]
MVGCRWNLLIVALYLSLSTCTLSVHSLSCPKGFLTEKDNCIDDDECLVDEGTLGPCGQNAICINTNGSFYCKCIDGFISSLKTVTFSADTSAKCRDINECLNQIDICRPHATCKNASPHYSCTCLDGFISSTGNKTFGPRDNDTCEDIDECKNDKVCDQNAFCNNTMGSYYCVCKAGFGLKSGQSNYTGDQEQCEDICVIDKTICGNGTCHREDRGHYCTCNSGFTNYGFRASRCTALDCDDLKDTSYLKETFRDAYELMVLLKESCLELTEREESKKLNGEDFLERLLSIIDDLLAGEPFKDDKKVSTFLDVVENAMKLIGPFMQPPGTNRSSPHTELQLLLNRGVDFPQGAVTLSSMKTRLDIKMETAAGDPSSYPGFTVVSMLSYANLNESAEGFYSGMKPKAGERFQIDSQVVTVSVSNLNTSHLHEPVNITLKHLKKQDKYNHTCVFWASSQGGGTWSADGCRVVESTSEHTKCSCNHLSSFAVLLALYDMEDKYELELISWVGLSLSLVCLSICILTFWLIHSIRSPRTTIHLHLCISLFIAILIFLAGISRTEDPVGCAVVAGLLHFFFLAAFCWMCLEGIQLFRMVVLVFNTNFKTLYMMAGGYGVPAVIVAISAIVDYKGYGTEKHCWLKLGFIWSFFGPVCIIIIINIFFFLITVRKLAQKFSSLNPDLDKLQKIKAFTITAVAQLCVLGTMWIFGCFQFEEGTIVMSYLFTIFGSLQGVMLFVMHCLCSKQVRDEYRNILSKCCAPKKKRYSEFSSSNSSKAPVSKSSHDTGESHI